MSVNESAMMHRAAVYQCGQLAGHLEQVEADVWQFVYADNYHGIPISLTMPVRVKPYRFGSFPPFFDGLLPEGPQLEALLRTHKIDRSDRFTQLVTVGEDLVGSLSVRLPERAVMRRTVVQSEEGE